MTKSKTAPLKTMGISQTSVVLAEQKYKQTKAVEKTPKPEAAKVVFDNRKAKDLKAHPLMDELGISGDSTQEAFMKFYVGETKHINFHGALCITKENLILSNLPVWYAAMEIDENTGLDVYIIDIDRSELLRFIAKESYWFDRSKEGRYKLLKALRYHFENTLEGMAWKEEISNRIGQNDINIVLANATKICRTQILLVQLVGKHIEESGGQWVEKGGDKAKAIGWGNIGSVIDGKIPLHVVGERMKKDDKANKNKGFAKPKLLKGSKSRPKVLVDWIQLQGKDNLAFNFKFKKTRLSFGAMALPEKGDMDITQGRNYVWVNEDGKPSIEIKLHWNVLSGQIPARKKRVTER